MRVPPSRVDTRLTSTMITKWSKMNDNQYAIFDRQSKINVPESLHLWNKLLLSIFFFFFCTCNERVRGPYILIFAFAHNDNSLRMRPQYLVIEKNVSFSRLESCLVRSLQAHSLRQQKRVLHQQIRQLLQQKLFLTKE